jgi:hypothetical protein
MGSPLARLFSTSRFSRESANIDDSDDSEALVITCASSVTPTYRTDITKSPTYEDIGIAYRAGVAGTQARNESMTRSPSTSFRDSGYSNISDRLESEHAESSSVGENSRGETVPPLEQHYGVFHFNL